MFSLRRALALFRTLLSIGPSDARKALKIMLDRKQHVSVEFYGGPLDGRRETIPIAGAHPSEHIAIPISQDRLHVINGEHPPHQLDLHTPTTVAFYELETRRNGRVRYLFLGAARAEDARAMWATKLI
jgi:hypothetical protein